MAKRPSLADSLKASLSKGVHIETAEKIAQGLPPIEDLATSTSSPCIEGSDSKPEDLNSNHIPRDPVNGPDIYPGNEPVHYSDGAGQQSGQPSGYSDNRPVHDMVNSPVIEPVSSSVNYPVNTSTNLKAKEPVTFFDKIVDPELWYPFTEKQGRILLYLLQAGGRANRNNISSDTGINIATVKHTMRILAKDGYIGNVRLYVEHSRRGFSYTINQAMCAEFASRFGKHISTSYPTNKPVIDQHNKLSVYPVNTQANNPVRFSPSFSSSSDQDLSTTKASDPEFGFWADLGVTERQLLNWEEEFQMSRSELLQCLRYCRYDLLNNPDRQDVKSPQNWFYKTVRKVGAYPKPEGYKSLQELKIERERKELEEMEKQALELAELRRKKHIASLDLKFQKILTDEGDEYHALLAEIKGLAREVGGIVLESALRRKFFEQNGVEVQL